MLRSSLTLAVSVSLLPTAQAATTPPPVDHPFLQTQAEQLYKAVAEGVRSAGGDLEWQHLHLVFAFSTGHFAKDPKMAEAARLVASDLVGAHLVSGDRLSAYAWEMGVWPHKGAALNPLTIGPDRRALRASVQDLWPRSPQAGSQGGHDTEATIAELTRRLADQSDVVLVLLTNSAASAAATRDQRTLGENDPAYRKALTRWNRIKSSNTTGASVQLSFQPDRPDRTFDAVLMVPRAFKGSALPQPRSQLVSEQVMGSEGKGTTDLPVWVRPLVVLGMLGVLGAAALMIRARNNRPTGEVEEKRPVAGRSSRSPLRLALKAGGQSFPLADVPPGETVCVLCGPSYPVGADAGRYVRLPAADLPPLKLLTVTREKAGLRLTPESEAVLGGDIPETLPLKDSAYRLRLSGRASAGPGLPPRPYQTEVLLTLSPLES